MRSPCPSACADGTEIAVIDDRLREVRGSQGAEGDDGSDFGDEG